MRARVEGTGEGDGKAGDRQQTMDIVVTDPFVWAIFGNIKANASLQPSRSSDFALALVPFLSHAPCPSSLAAKYMVIENRCFTTALYPRPRLPHSKQRTPNKNLNNKHVGDPSRRKCLVSRARCPTCICPYGRKRTPSCLFCCIAVVQPV